MWTWVRATGEVPEPIDRVAGMALADDGLARWHDLLAEVSPGDGPEGRAVVNLRGREVPARLRVTRTVRDVVHLALEDDDGAVLELDVALAPWHGATVVELGVAGERFDGARLPRAALARALRRSVANIDRLARVPAPASPRGRRTRLLPEVEVAGERSRLA